MPAAKKGKTPDFVTLLQEQLDYLQDKEYSYEVLRIFVAGDSEGFEFGFKDEIEIDKKNQLLIARDGPVKDADNADIPEYVIKLDQIVASQLE